MGQKPGGVVGDDDLVFSVRIRDQFDLVRRGVEAGRDAGAGALILPRTDVSVSVFLSIAIETPLIVNEPDATLPNCDVLVNDR